ncbi:MAG: putative Ig domain-containing protein, partial [Thermoleophilaceae bacterium]
MASDARASHFRGGNISYQQTGAATNAAFESTVSFRCSFFGPCPAVGDTVNLSGSILDFGDGTQSDDEYVVVAVNAAEDNFTARKNVAHNYPDTSARTAFFSSCCTISELLNNNDASFRVETLVDLGQDPNSPKTSVPPVVNVGSSGNQTFLVPATDPGGQTLRFRLATDAEAGGNNVNPPDYSINATTGQVTFDTTGKSQGLFHSSIVIEALDGSSNVVSSTLVTFLIRVGQQAGNQAPQYVTPPTPPDGTEFTVAPGQNLAINLAASDPDIVDIVQIVPGPLPPGATFNQTSGNPATGTFSFTPTAGQDGQDFVVNFTAQDQNGGSTFRSYTIKVRPAPKQCADGEDNDGDGKTDHPDDPGCSSADDDSESPDPPKPP